MKLEAEDDSSSEVDALLVVANFDVVAVAEVVALGASSRVAVGGHVSKVAAETEMIAHEVLRTTSDVVGEDGAARVSAAVILVGETEAAGDVGTQFAIVVELREHS